MKKLLPLLTLAALAAAPAQARQISPAEALGRFHASAQGPELAPQQGSETLVATLPTPDGAGAALYLYSRPQGGFLLLSADDAVTSLLAYSDQGTAPQKSQMPPAMQWLLDGYAQQIQLARTLQANGIPFSSPREDNERETIPVLCQTSWDQDKPYNNLAPTIGGGKCPTGCVATAAAQVLYYHKHPEHPNGSIAYDYEASNGQNQHIEANFSEMTFEWQYMLRNYSQAGGSGGSGGTLGGYSSKQANAVATLMWALGAGSRMMYNSGGSGTFDFEMARCLVEFMDMNPGLWVGRRRYNTAENWDNLVYNELSQNGPVIYVGADGTVSGHCFVADGYKNNKYHINWGWGGSSDGYFSLENLVTGGWFGYDFTWDMGALIDVRPNDSTATVIPQLALNSGSLCTDREAYCRADNDLIQLSSEPGSENTEEQNTKFFWNFTAGPMPQTEAGLRLVRLNNPADTAYATADPLDIEVGQRVKHIDLPSSRIPVGTWKADLGFRSPDGLWREIPVELIARRELTLTVTADSVKVFGLDSNPNLDITVTDLSVPDKFRTSRDVTVSARLTNNGQPVYTTVFPQIKSQQDGKIYWATPTITILNTGATKNISVNSPFRHEDEFTGEPDYPEPGLYTFSLVTDGGLQLGEACTVQVLTRNGAGVDAIQADTDAEVVATERFTLSGQTAAPDAKGLLLIRQTLSDGSTRSRLQVAK